MVKNLKHLKQFTNILNNKFSLYGLGRERLLAQATHFANQVLIDSNQTSSQWQICACTWIWEQIGLPNGRMSFKIQTKRKLTIVGLVVISFVTCYNVLQSYFV